MKVLYGINQIKKYPRPVVALGVFDGVHLGHRRILSSARNKARQIKGTAVALTFWPHPQREESIYSLEHRLRLIKEQGISVCIVINFSERFKQISAADFVKDILLKRLGARYVYVGKNFSFGKEAEGNFRTLKELAGIYHFKLKLFRVIKIKNQPVSSTYIRKLIKKGDIASAQKLLARSVSVLGTVIRGNFLAQRFGFPTANIQAHHEVILPAGVYAVRVILNGKIFSGICYIGSRPTIAGKVLRIKKHGPQTHIEVHLFNFNKKIYRKYLEVQFIKKLREEKKFPSFSSLAVQIKKDILSTKRQICLP